MVDGALLDLYALVLEVLQERVVKDKLALQGAIGDPAVLRQWGNKTCTPSASHDTLCHRKIVPWATGA
jgi:hypothetical protein